MALTQYNDTPLLFITSTDSSAPKGRNVRTKARVEAVSQNRSNQAGEFTVIDLRNTKRPSSADASNNAAVKRSRKRRSTIDVPASQAEETEASSGTHASQPHPDMLDLIKLPPPPYLLAPPTWCRIQNPSNVLVVAAFHIRRMTANTLKGRPERLKEVLRFRQWSCVPTAIERVGNSACLDSALACLAFKLNRMTGGTTSYRSVLVSHTQALHQLQLALAQPHRHEFRDLFTATQLLAVFEMLDSLDNDVWLQHVAGAGTLLLTNGKSVQRNDAGLDAGIVLPVITDALLGGNTSFLNHCDWRTALHSLMPDSSSADEAELGCSLTEALQLILDANTMAAAGSLDSKTRYALLDRAHSLKARLQPSLRSDTYVDCDFSKVQSFDKLALCFTELLALDRVIASLRPRHSAEWESDDGKTCALCEQLLQLELRDADGNPAEELLSAFQLSK